MGRLTLNVLLSFAQFEREVTGERIRDKIAASKKKGIWMGGVVPLGYRVESRKLVVDAAEADTVRLIFRRYLELASLPALQRDLHERGITSRPRVLASGREIGGVAFTNGPLAYMLKNRMVLGELNHRGVSYKSEHPAIVDADLFEAVQAKLSAEPQPKGPAQGQVGRAADRLHLRRSRPPDGARAHGPRRAFAIATMSRPSWCKAARRRLAPSPACRHRKSRCSFSMRCASGCQMDLPEARQDQRERLEQLDLHVDVRDQALEITWLMHRAMDKPQAQPPDTGDDECDGERQRISIPYVFNAHKRRRDIVLPTTTSGYIRPIEQAEQQSLNRSIAQGRGWL